MFEPEGAVQQGIILLRCTNVEPNPVEAGGRLQLGLGDVRRVVPQGIAAEGGEISDNKDQQDEREDDGIAPLRRSGSGDLRWLTRLCVLSTRHSYFRRLRNL